MRDQLILAIENLQLRIVETVIIDPVDTLHQLQVIDHQLGITPQVLIVGHALDQYGGGRERIRRDDFQHQWGGSGFREIVFGILDFTPQVGQVLVIGTLIDLVETDQQAADRFAAVAGDKLDIRHRLDRILQRVGNLFFHVLGGGSRQQGLDHDPVEIDVGVLLPWQAEIGQDADDQHQGKGQVRQYIVLEEA